MASLRKYQRFSANYPDFLLDAILPDNQAAIIKGMPKSKEECSSVSNCYVTAYRNSYWPCRDAYPYEHGTFKIGKVQKGKRAIVYFGTVSEEKAGFDTVSESQLRPFDKDFEHQLIDSRKAPPSKSVKLQLQRAYKQALMWIKEDVYYLEDESNLKTDYDMDNPFPDEELPIRLFTNFSFYTEHGELASLAHLGSDDDNLRPVHGFGVVVRKDLNTNKGIRVELESVDEWSMTLASPAKLWVVGGYASYQLLQPSEQYRECYRQFLNAFGMCNALYECLENNSRIRNKKFKHVMSEMLHACGYRGEDILAQRDFIWQFMIPHYGSELPRFFKGWDSITKATNGDRETEVKTEEDNTKEMKKGDKKERKELELKPLKQETQSNANTNTNTNNSNNRTDITPTPKVEKYRIPKKLKSVLVRCNNSEKDNNNNSDSIQNDGSDSKKTKQSNADKAKNVKTNNMTHKNSNENRNRTLISNSDVTNSSTSSDKPRTIKTWVQSYQELKQHYKKFGRLPYHTENRPLYKWCINQRVQWRKNTLTEWKCAKLDKLKFPWSIASSHDNSSQDYEHSGNDNNHTHVHNDNSNEDPKEDPMETQQTIALTQTYTEAQTPSDKKRKHNNSSPSSSSFTSPLISPSSSLSYPSASPSTPCTPLSPCSQLATPLYTTATPSLFLDLNEMPPDECY